MSQIPRAAALPVRGQTCIEVFVFLFVVGGGAWAGESVASQLAPGHPIRGAAIGVLSVFSTLKFIGYLGRWRFSNHPPCRCGKNQPGDFTFVRDPEEHLLRQCSCGRRYTMRRGRFWFEILGDQQVVLYMQEDFWGRWVPASEENKARWTIRRHGSNK